MEQQQHWRHGRIGLSYSNLFNLESLMNFHIPQPDDGFNAYSNGIDSEDESRSSQDALGQGHLRDRCDGSVAADGPSNLTRRRKRLGIEPEVSLNSSLRRDMDSNEDDDEDFDNQITEEQYRAMLGEHVQKFRSARFKESSSGTGTTRTAMRAPKHRNGLHTGRIVNAPVVSIEEETPPRRMDASPEYYDTGFDSDYVEFNMLGSSNDSTYLDIGEGIKYGIPPPYEKLATDLNLPSFLDIHIEEYVLKGNLDLRSLAAMLALDGRFETRNHGGGLGEPLPQYGSLQARIKALSTGNSAHKFTLQISDIILDPFSIPEGAAGRIRRSIMSESGTLQVYYVKVIEKGDTYEIIERSLPKKQIVKKDPLVVEQEEMEKNGKAWMNIAKRDIPKHHRIFTSFHKKKLADVKRCSETCQREVKQKVSRTLKFMKAASNRTRKLARDMLIFWKRVDKEQAEVRKKEEREAAEALKREEELRESRRQQQLLEFVIKQTELYSHFMGNKPEPQQSECSHAKSEVKVLEKADADIKQGEGDSEEANVVRKALKAAQHAVSQQKMKTSAFDSECSILRQQAEAENEPSIEGSSNIDLLHPSTMPVTSSVQTPEMFKGSLKEYQLKGLQWLVNCYDQGLNGILADEMGLGKTIQAMAFLAHLAEEKNIWGPFLVVAPASVLNNWSDEINRFCPDLKVLPYWDSLSTRSVLRKNINPRKLYKRDAEFHILITSYQLLVTDEKYLRRVKWQYMVLDEAQAIKSAASIRWKTLLNFNCRNRLLLTGTPIQNNMAELWALLHFIMPTLFDSHDQFNEWFSKGIENHAEHGGTLNEHQLNRLHAVLKPFMLRRLKKDVISEMTAKVEVTVHCKLSSRQQAFYQAIKNKISLAELLDGSRGHLNDKKLENLMNIVIQLRKVCNHPELFERNDGSSYLYFGEIPNACLSTSFGELEDIPYPGGRNPITYLVPKLVHQEIIRASEISCSMRGYSMQNELFERYFDIFSPSNIYQSTFCETSGTSGTFEFSRLINLSPVEVSFLAKGTLLERLLFYILRQNDKLIDEVVDLFMNLEGDDLHHNWQLEQSKVRTVSRMLMLPAKSQYSFLRRKLATGSAESPYEPLVVSDQDRFVSEIRFLRSTYSFIPHARAPPINADCHDRNFSYQTAESMHHPWVKKLFTGCARTSEFNGPRRPRGSHHLIQEIDDVPHIVPPALGLTYKIFGSSPPMQSFDPAKMLTDSGKLQTLDSLLKRLRAENHRVLLFAQMTKMLDILEDYMNYRKYKYFRLDGSCSIMERRDMVRDFQYRGDVFVFLLSTRAGGLGINLTAADTVIFYESDWNPTLDLQAMDRAHRLGQTKEVTVYRMICKETIEEKILQRASQKSAVQQLVMTGGHIQGDHLLRTEDVVSLLLDDAQLEEKLREIPRQANDRQKKKRVTKGIKVGVDGDLSLEEFQPLETHGDEHELADHKTGKTSSKKRKPPCDKQKHLKPQISHKLGKIEEHPDEGDPGPSRPETEVKPNKRVKKPKRPSKRGASDAIEAATGPASTFQQDLSYHDDEYGAGPAAGGLPDSGSPT